MYSAACVPQEAFSKSERKSLPLAKCSSSSSYWRLRLLLFLVCWCCWYDDSAYAQQAFEANKQFDCYSTNGSSTLGYSCNGARNSCVSYLTFRSATYYQSPVQIAYLLGVEASNISSINGVSDVYQAPLGDLVLVPTTCSCAAAADEANYYQHNASYTLKFNYETYFIIANNTYEGLTTCQALIAQNPSYESHNLSVGLQIDVPLRCACPTAGQQDRWGTRYLLSYLIAEGDDLQTIADRFGVDLQAIVEANSLASDSTIYPLNTLLIPLANEPNKDQLALFNNPPPPPPTSPPPPPPGSAGGSGSKGRGGVFIGVGIGVGVAAVLGVFLLIWWFRRRRRLTTSTPLPVTDEDRSRSPSSSFPLNSGESIAEKLGSFPADQIMAQSIREAIESLKVYEFHELEKATGSFSEDRRIKGATTVYKGSINGDEAAIKRLRSMGDLANEISVLKQINHSNVIRLSGFCLHKGNTYLVYEYAEKGSLDDWVHLHHHHHLSWKQRIQIAHDIADALNYLHNYSHPPYVHLNLNSSNVLLDAGYRAKLANFALARAVQVGEEDERAPLTRHVRGTHGYMAPEYLQDGLITPKVDVFAFGVVLLELMSGKEAASSTSKDGEEKKESLLWASIEPVLSGEGVQSKLRAFIDPRVRDDCSLTSAFSMAEIAMKCVAKQPGSRPSMTEVLLSLSALYNSALDWDSSDFTNSSSISMEAN